MYCTINIVPGTFVFNTITIKNSDKTENLTVGADGEKYAIAVSEATLKTKLNQIYTYNISQDRGERIDGLYTKDACAKVATYHNYMLLGKVSSPNITDAIDLDIYKAYNERKIVDTNFDTNGNGTLDGSSTTKGTEAYNYYNTIKTYIDAGHPVRLKVLSNTNVNHYVTIVGYELELNAGGTGIHGNGIPDKLNDLLIIGSYNGKLFSGADPTYSNGKGEILGGIYSDAHLDVYNK